MGTFTGFSEDDIRKLQTTENKQNDSKGTSITFK